MNKNSKKLFPAFKLIVLLSVIFGILGFLVFRQTGYAGIESHLPQRIFCLNKSAFSQTASSLQKDNSLNSDGTIRYFYDDFKVYQNASLLIHDYESQNQTVVTGITIKEVSDSNEHINGERSLKIVVAGSSVKEEATTIKIVTTFQDPISMWGRERGVFTGWIHVPDQH